MARHLILHTKQGFTLLEMMIVVVLIGILAAIAYPNYIEYITRSNRTEGMALLSDAAARQERYFAQNSKYIKGTDETTDSIKNLGLPNTITAKNKVISASGYYELELTYKNDKTDGGYTLTATPQGSQALRDTACGALTLNARGDKGSAGDLDRCWR